MRIFLTFLACLAAGQGARAHQSLTLVQAYAFETTAGMANGAAYISVENLGSTVADLVGVASEVAEVTQVHTHVQHGDLRRMVALDLPLPLAPGQRLTMEPGGIHVMLLGLKAPLEVGDRVQIALDFEGRHARDFEVMVQVYGLDQFENLVVPGATNDKDRASDEPSAHDHSGHEH